MPTVPRTHTPAKSPPCSCPAAAPEPAAPVHPPRSIVSLTIQEIESYLAGARSAVDDLWAAADDAASKRPTFTRTSLRRRKIPRAAFDLLQHLRCIERELDNLRKQARETPADPG